MRCLACLFLLVASAAGAPDAKEVETANLERTRLMLQTVINTHPHSPMASEAKDELNAIQLYEEGLQRMREGRYDAAEFTFQTLLSVYPESRLARQARDGMQQAAQSRKALTVGLTVRSINCTGLGVADRDIQRIFTEREIRLSAGRAFDPRDVEEARTALTGFLAELGTPGVQIRSETRMAGEHEVDIVLARVK